MGLLSSYLDYILDCVNETLGDLAGKRMLELGDQVVYDDRIPEATGKEYYEKRGLYHTSVDLNGQHGALRVDLSKPIRNRALLDAFDVVTNCGTSEHIEPLKAQYVCFMNVHNCLKQGGIAIHLVPDIVELEQHGRWKNHCNNYYSHEFFRLLAELNGYTLVSSKVINGQRCVCLQKNSQAPFTQDQDAVLAAISLRQGGTVYPGVNDHRLIRPVTRILWRLLDSTRPTRCRLGLTKSAILSRFAASRSVRGKE
jgi:hypothetical protein